MMTLPSEVSECKNRLVVIDFSENCSQFLRRELFIRDTYNSLFMAVCSPLLRVREMLRKINGRTWRIWDF